MVKRENNPLIPCKCGCGNMRNKYDCRGDERGFISGHNHRGKSNTWKIVDNPSIRTARHRAVKILKINVCQVNNALCKGRIQTHHVDKNPKNNDPKNLRKLCTAHHRLADYRNLDVDELKLISPQTMYVDGSGKRRYDN